MKEKLSASNQFINARYNYSSVEIDIMLHVIARLDQSNPNQRTVQFSVHEVESIANQHATFQYANTACEALLRKPYQIWDGRNYWGTNFFHTYQIDTKTGVISVTVSDKMWSILMDVKKEFTVIGLKDILHLDGKHAKRLYMLACQFQNTGNRNIALDELRQTLSVNYPSLKDLKERVIMPAINEINEKTNLMVDVIYKKVGYSITALSLSIALKQTIQTVNYDQKIQSEPMDIQRIRQRLLQYGLQPWFANNVIIKLEQKEIAKVLHKLQTAKTPVNNTASYLWKAFTNLGVPQTKIEQSYRIEDLQPELEAIEELRRRLS